MTEDKLGMLREQEKRFEEQRSIASLSSMQRYRDAKAAREKAELELNAINALKERSS
jgi:hypothetical protein